MILISDVENYTQQIKDALPAFKKTFPSVVDDSQLVKFLAEITEDDNLILVPFIPSHVVSGTNADQAQNKDHLLFLILHKSTRADGHDIFIQQMKLCQSATRDLVKKIVQDKDREGDCSNFMRKLLVSSIMVNPIWGLSGCDGYEIEFQLESSLWV